MKQPASRLALRLLLLCTVLPVAAVRCVDTRKPPAPPLVLPEIDASMFDPGAGTDIDAGMRTLTSMELVREMGIGWNLGNTLDAVGGETAWGNPPTTQEMIAAIAAAGFRSMRIPVTWRQHFGPAPDYPIDPAWLDRVQQIVDWAHGAGLYVILNMHHDGGTDFDKGAWIRLASTDPEGISAQYRALWTQIAARFRDYDDRLVLESMNEVGFDDLNVNGQPSAAAYNLLNRLNREFVDLIRGAGGNHRYRHLLVAGYNTDFDLSIRGVVMPRDTRCILSLHYYTPYQFAINGKPTTWGSPAEVATLVKQFAKVKASFIDRGIPVILGEYGAVRKTEAASRVYWVECVAKVAVDHGIAPFFWDPGNEFDRRTFTWRTPGLLEALKRAGSGLAYVPTKG
jgi:endoglucanase